MTLSFEKYDNVEYLTREFSYVDKFGNSHCYNVADEKLSEVLWNEEKQDYDCSDIDNKYYCYAPVSALLIEDDQEFALWLEENVTEMELK